MDGEAMVTWLVSEAGAGWAAALLVLIVALVGWITALLRRDRPPLVVIQEIASIRLLDIHPSQRDRLTVIYSYEDGMEIRVEDLRQKDIVIYNNGTKDVLDPLEVELRVVAPGSDQGPFQGFWQWFSEDKRIASTVIEEEASETVADTVMPGLAWHGVRIQLPYLNSYPLHRDYVAAHIVCDGEIEMALWARQSGKGWSARFVPLQQSLRLQRRVGMTVLAVAGLLLLVCYLWISIPEPSPSLILRLIPATILMVATGLLILQDTITAAVWRRVMRARLPSEFRSKAS
jgi:hypothetical protein